jgi:hypothetical protein
MSNQLAPIAKQLGKFIRLFSSDQDGEVVAAARALIRTLRNAGLDIHTLAETVETKTWTDEEAREMFQRGLVRGREEAESKQPVKFHNVNGEPDWPAIAEACLEHRIHKSATESEFCAAMLRCCECGGEPTPKQAAWLQKIYARRPT